MDIMFIFSVIIPSGVTGSVVSALWNHFSARSLQRNEARLQAQLSTLKDRFEHSQRLSQAAIDRSVFVTRAHFETEFDAMKQVFAYLSRLHIGLNGLRPRVPFGAPDESEDQKVARLFERMDKAFAAYNNLLVESEAKSPFYPAELYDAIEECQGVAVTEINSVRTSGANMFEPTWYEEGERNYVKFSKAYRKAADIIRDRISRLAILPG